MRLFFCHDTVRAANTGTQLHAVPSVCDDVTEMDLHAHARTPTIDKCPEGYE